MAHCRQIPVAAIGSAARADVFRRRCSQHDCCFALQPRLRLAWFPTLRYHFYENTHRNGCPDTQMTDAEEPANPRKQAGVEPHPLRAGAARQHHGHRAEWKCHSSKAAIAATA
jgi:hypothetical protein